MKRGLRERILLLAITTLVALYCLLPTFGVQVPWAQKITLGLDLQGGMHLVLEVDLDKFLENFTDRQLADARRILEKEGIVLAAATRTGVDRGRLVLTKSADREKATKALRDLSSLEVTGGSGEEILLGVPAGQAAELRRSAVKQAVEKIRNRVDQFGVAEPHITTEGDRRLIVQLPGIREPQRAINLIGQTALLEFKLADDEANLEEAVRDQGKIPEGDQLLYDRKEDARGNVTRTPLLVKRQPIVTGNSLVNASASPRGDVPGWQVNFQFDQEGARIFGEATTRNVGRRLAIILDDTVVSAPVIQEPITRGQGRITGDFTDKQAADLALVLRAGALPAPVNVVANLTVGASLGEDSIRQGIRASVLGALLVVVLMGVYYRWSGALADAALIVNVFMTLGALALLKATLTLPGIAGVVLSIGMAVDTNVLVFERIREELRLGKTVRAAIEAGYQKAFVAIIDAHVTTLITAAALYYFGSGPIKGFAVTLSLGIVINLFTAITGTRVVFDWRTSRRTLAHLSI
ncbi:MAG TPA: protein translocase subunit SecD [Candidatus Methylomirabilis sp.]